MEKEVFLKNLKNWDGKYESLIPEIGLPDPTNWSEFRTEFFTRMYGSNFYQECILPIYVKAREEYKNDKCRCDLECYGEMWKYERCADDVFGIYLGQEDHKEANDYSISKAKMWISVANLYDIFKENPEAAKVWARYMDKVGQEIAYQGARAAYDRGDNTVKGMAKGVLDALYAAKPFQPNDLVYNVNFYGEAVWGSINTKDNEKIANKEAETMSL